MRKKFGRFDLIFFICVFVISAALYAAKFFLTKSDGTLLVVTVDNSIYGKYDLSKNQTIKIKKDGHIKNVVKIKDGYAYMKEADCPDKLCVHMKKISQVNETIVCLPNQVILTIEKK